MCFPISLLSETFSTVSIIVTTFPFGPKLESRVLGIYNATPGFCLSFSEPFARGTCFFVGTRLVRDRKDFIYGRKGGPIML